VLQLDLRGNGLTNDGAIIVSRGLRSAESKKLAELDMGYNEIKDDGACALAQVRLLASQLTRILCVLHLGERHPTGWPRTATWHMVDFVCLQCAACSVAKSEVMYACQRVPGLVRHIAVAADAAAVT
jgi:hypothetical protein